MGEDMQRTFFFCTFICREVAFSELVDAFKLEADTKDDETPILMRSLQLSDAPKLNELVNKNIAHLSPWMPWAKKPNSAEETEAFVRMTMNDLVARRAVQYGIFVGNEIVGCIGNHPVQVCENYTKTSIGTCSAESACPYRETTRILCVWPLRI